MRSIYRLVCSTTGQVYIGQTSKEKQRERDHFSKLRSGKHTNPLIQSAFNQYGAPSFYFEIVESNIPDEQSNDRERYWVGHFDSFKNGFNLTNSGQGKSNYVCSWNGIIYNSLKECADANGKAPAVMIHRFSKGYKSDADMYGSGIKKACTWNGVSYRGIRIAARAIGIPYPTLQHWIAKGYTGDTDIARAA